MHEVSFEEALAKIAVRDLRYQPEAYLFVREALDHTQKVVAKDARGRIRHVTARNCWLASAILRCSSSGP